MSRCTGFWGLGFQGLVFWIASLGIVFMLFRLQGVGLASLGFRVQGLGFGVARQFGFLFACRRVRRPGAFWGCLGS